MTELMVTHPGAPEVPGALRERGDSGMNLVAETGEQPYRYQRRALVEPDWTRFPGWRDVTAADWRSAQWQRSHCVKTVAQLHAVLGDLADERFYADLARDQAERATMSMLMPDWPSHRMASRYSLH